MLAKKYRLQLAEYPRKGGALRRGRYLFISSRPAEVAYARFAVVVPAAALARATARNRIKRAIYDALKKRVGVSPYLDRVITVQRSAAEAPLRAILDELDLLLSH